MWIIALMLAWTDPLLEFKQDAYGPGIHSDQYGRAYKTKPLLKIKPNTYGLGVHSDQYGRIVIIIKPEVKQKVNTYK